MGHDATPLAPPTFHSERLGAAAAFAALTHRRLPLTHERPEQSSSLPIFGAHHHPPQACRGASLAHPDPSSMPLSRACPCSTGLSLIYHPRYRDAWPDHSRYHSDERDGASLTYPHHRRSHSLIAPSMSRSGPANVSLPSAASTPLLVSRASDPASPLCRDCCLTLPVRSCVIPVSLSLPLSLTSLLHHSHEKAMKMAGAST